MDPIEAKSLTQVHGTPKVQMATDAMVMACKAMDAIWQGDGQSFVRFEHLYPGIYLDFDDIDEDLQRAMEFAIEHFPNTIWVYHTVGGDFHVFAGTEEEVLEALERGRVEIALASANERQKEAASSLISALQSLDTAGLAIPSVGVAAREVAALLDGNVGKDLRKEIVKLFPTTTKG